MNQCQNCGQANAPESQFCRFCGTRFLVRQSAQPQDQAYQPPRPYAWKTDEYQTHTDARRTHPSQPADAQPLAPRDSQYVTGNYRCPNCMSQFLPRIERRISTTGWIVFAVLLVFVFPLFWIGLLIKEDVHVCPTCEVKLK